MTDYYQTITTEGPSNWYRDRWIEAQGKPSPYWHSLPPVVVLGKLVYPWDLPGCTSLVVEGPKAIIHCPNKQRRATA